MLALSSTSSTRSSDSQETLGLDTGHHIHAFLDLFWNYDADTYQWSLDEAKLQQVNEQFQNFSNSLERKSEKILLTGAVLVVLTSLIPHRVARVITTLGLVSMAGWVWKSWISQADGPPKELLDNDLPEGVKKLVNIFRNAAHECRATWRKATRKVCTKINQDAKTGGHWHLEDKSRIKQTVHSSYHMIVLERFLDINQEVCPGLTMFDPFHEQQPGLLLYDLDKRLFTELLPAVREFNRMLKGRISCGRNPCVQCTLQEGSNLIISAKRWPVEEELLPILSGSGEEDKQASITHQDLSEEEWP